MVVTTAAKNIIKAYLNISDGCIEIKPISAHLFAPFNSNPTPGIITNNCITIATKKICDEFLRNHRPEIFLLVATKNMATNPASTAMICLVKIDKKNPALFKFERDAEKKINIPATTNNKVV